MNFDTGIAIVVSFVTGGFLTAWFLRGRMLRMERALAEANRALDSAAVQMDDMERRLNMVAP